MSSLVVIAKVNVYRASAVLSLVDERMENILVHVEGAVAKPGSYLVPAGTTVEMVLRKCRPKPWADIQILPLRQMIEAPMSLHVDELTEITVTVIGAVLAPLKVVLPAKSRLCDLKRMVVLSEEADKSYFRRRKWLKNGDVIDVPKKTVE